MKPLTLLTLLLFSLAVKGQESKIHFMKQPTNQKHISFMVQGDYKVEVIDTLYEIHDRLPVRVILTDYAMKDSSAVYRETYKGKLNPVTGFWEFMSVEVLKRDPSKWVTIGIMGQGSVTAPWIYKP